MKKPVLVIAWLVSCAAAFGVGAVVMKSKSGGVADATGPIRGGTVPTIGSSPGAQGASAPKVPGAQARAKTDDPFAAYVRGGVVSPEDMKLLMKKVMDENDPIKRSELFTKLLANLTPENAKDAYDQLRQTRNRFDMEKSQLLLNAWGRVDGKGAMAQLMAQREADAANGQGEQGGRGRGGRGGFGGPGGGGFGGRGGDMEMASVLSGWATVDTKEATSYVDGLKDLDDRQKSALNAGIVQGLLVNGVSDAMSYVSSLSKDDQGRQWMMGSIAREVLEDGIDAAANWATSITDPELRAGALNEVADRFVRDDLDAAKAWVAGLAGESYAESAVRQVAGELASKDPASALAWANTLPASAQGQVYDQALGAWAREDPTAASEYLNGLSNSPAKDQAINGFATNVSREDPESAVAWASAISDQALRTETLTDVARSWYFRDEAAASAWLETSGLPVDAIEKITTPPQRGDGGPGGGGGRGGRRGGG